MRKIIHNIRQKPDHHKKAISFGLSFLITSFIFGVWFMTQFGDSDIVKSNTTVLGPMAAVWQGFISIFR